MSSLCGEQSSESPLVCCATRLEVEQRLAWRLASEVAQIFNLPYRRVTLGRTFGVSRRCGTSDAPQNAILRYGAARRSRNQSSAELHSAVSPICNRLAVRRNPPADPFEPSAEYNSAIQQITNLRYEKSSRRATTWTDTDRVQLCATPTGPPTFCILPTSDPNAPSDFGLRISGLASHPYFPAILFAWRIIHSSFFARASAP